MNGYRATLALAVAAGWFNVAGGTFLDTGWSARQEGSAGAFVAGVGSAADLLGNPAGIVDIQGHSCELSGSLLSTDEPKFTATSAAYALPAGSLSLGMAYTAFDAGGLYREWRWAGTFAVPLQALLGRLDVAVSAVFLGTGVAFDVEESDVLTGVRATAVGGTVDLGIRWAAQERVVFGCMVRNAVAANVSLVGGDALVPRDVRVGAALRLGDAWGFEETRIACSAGYREQTWGDAADRWRWALGVETFLYYGSIVLRIGVSERGMSGGMGVFRRVTGPLCAGLDYALQLPFDAGDGSLVVHRLSFAVEFR